MLFRSGNPKYECVIHVRGNYIVGRYSDEITAAIAYNKAVDILAAKGFKRNYSKNYIQSLSSEEYLEKYDKIEISRRIMDFTK